MNENILQAVLEVIYKEMKWDATIECDPNKLLTKYGIDSLKAITILFNLEEKLDIVVPNEVIESVGTISDIVSEIQIILGESNEN
jgi:acyl carrier protein